jgi:hypothetical protein
MVVAQMASCCVLLVSTALLLEGLRMALQTTVGHSIFQSNNDPEIGGGTAGILSAVRLHFTVAYGAVPDDTAPGGIGGVLATVHEITEKVVGQRRITVLRDLGARTAEAGHIDGEHARPTHGQQPRVVPLAAAQIQPRQAFHAWQHFQKCGRIEQVAIRVVALAAKARPGFGILFPVAARFAIVH